MLPGIAIPLDTFVLTVYGESELVDFAQWIVDYADLSWTAGLPAPPLTKPNGETVTLKYDLPTPATLYIKANVQAFDGSLDVNVIKNQLLQELDFNAKFRVKRHFEITDLPKVSPIL